MVPEVSVLHVPSYPPWEKGLGLCAEAINHPWEKGLGYAQRLLPTMGEGLVYAQRLLTPHGRGAWSMRRGF